jgi:NhaP-type Na+/H+ or K+/H+ antiporter
LEFILSMEMNDNKDLFWIKTLHTGIWLFFNVVIFYLLYAVISNKIDKWVWICLVLIVMEGLILLVFKAVCPITLIARKYSDSQAHNFDIFLPEWLAKHNKTIYTSIVTISVIVLIYQLIWNSRP